MAVFPLLTDPDAYHPCDTDLLVNERARAYWLELFETHFEVQLEAAASIGIDATARRSARADLAARLAAIAAEPSRLDRLDILVLDEVRKGVLDAHGIVDEFRVVKARENEAALAGLGPRLADLDEQAEPSRVAGLIHGLLAGNLFDMGAAHTARQYTDGPVPFSETLEVVPDRPWLFDHVEAAAAGLSGTPPRRAVIFADNAGGDLVLGILPLVRHLLRLGAEVVLTANTQPSLNDVTIEQMREIVGQAAAIDASFSAPALSLVASGCTAPLIDLTRISDELATAAVGGDLVVLVGMGRAIESNWSARFDCPSWRVAMIKDPQVAETVGGRLLDAVCRVDSPSR